MTVDRSPARPEDVIREALKGYSGTSERPSPPDTDAALAALGSLVTRQQELEAERDALGGELAKSNRARHAAEARLAEAERERAKYFKAASEAYEEGKRVGMVWKEARLRQTEQALREAEETLRAIEEWDAFDAKFEFGLNTCRGMARATIKKLAALDAQPANQACTCQGVWSEHGYVVSHGPGCTLDAQPAELSEPPLVMQPADAAGSESARATGSGGGGSLSPAQPAEEKP